MTQLAEMMGFQKYITSQEFLKQTRKRASPLKLLDSITYAAIEVFKYLIQPKKISIQYLNQTKLDIVISKLSIS